MRVALDATPLLGHRTGVGRFVAELVAALVADRLATVDGWVLSGRASAAEVAGLRGLGFTALTRTRVPASVLVPLWARLGRPLLSSLGGPAEVLHGTNFVVPPGPRPKVVTVHDLSYIHDAASVGRSVARFDGSVRRAVADGAAVHVPSRHVAGEVEDRYPGAQVHVVPEGAPQVRARPAPGSSGEPALIVAVGTALPRKRMAVLVEAFATMAGRPGAAGVALELIGAAGPDSVNVGAAVDRLPSALRARVRMRGALPDEDVRAALDRARVLAVPSAYEGFGLTLLEGMAAGTPVVTTSGGALAEVAGDAALVVPPDDAEVFGSALWRVVTDDDLARDLQQRGYQRARSYRWSDTARGLLALYENLA